MKKSFITTITAALFAGAFSVSAFAAMSAEDKTKVDAALASAETEYKKAKAIGHVFRLIDPATGKKSKNLGRLLEAGQDAAAEGKINEALRIAKKVEDAAKAGQDQAARAADAKPHYPGQ